VRCWPDAGAAPESPPFVTPVRHAGAGRRWRSAGFQRTEQGAEALTWIVDVPALERRLADAVGYQSGIDRLTEAPACALTIVCEGKRSQTRDELGIEFDVRPYPHKALAARLRCEQPHGGVARQWFRDGQIMALLPLEGDARELCGAGLVTAGHQLALHNQGWTHPLFVAAGTGALPAVLGDMRWRTGQAWPLELSRASRWIARTPQGAAVLAGDAAHAMHPLAGQGLNVGLADVAELARVLHANASTGASWATCAAAALRKGTPGRRAHHGLADRRPVQPVRTRRQPRPGLRNWGMTRVDHLGRSSTGWPARPRACSA
jgi:2-polyprenyl-6-methoxyphenol hydroxylase-like FAD-dependent oxidoreductase